MAFFLVEGFSRSTAHLKSEGKNCLSKFSHVARIMYDERPKLMH